MKNFSTSIQRRKRGKRTEYFARLTYYDKTGKRKGVSKSAATHWDAKRELQDLNLSGKGRDVSSGRTLAVEPVCPSADHASSPRNSQHPLGFRAPLFNWKDLSGKRIGVAQEGWVAVGPKTRGASLSGGFTGVAISSPVMSPRNASDGH